MKLGLLTRLFTATQGRPDESEADVSPTGPEWERNIATKSQFEAGLDLAKEIGADVVEISQSGQPSGAEYLLENASARTGFLHTLECLGLQIAALNCSGIPLHPVRGTHSERMIRTTIRLAEKLGVKTIVAMSGAAADGANSSPVNWIFYPWPQESLDLLERQWERIINLWARLATMASDHGVEKIAIELHPMHLVYNVPTLERLREAVGPAIGANLDPSHLVWQQMDPLAVAGALGPAIHHVHLKDTQLIKSEIATAGVLDQRPFSNPDQRAWIQRTIGRGHGTEFWSKFFQSLELVDYQGAVCIEHEDPFQSYADGVREAGAFLRPLLPSTI